MSSIASMSNNSFKVLSSYTALTRALLLPDVAFLILLWGQGSSILNLSILWFEPRSISSLYVVIIWVRVVLTRTVVDWTLRMTSTQVVEISVTNNSSFQNYSHPDNHNIRTIYQSCQYLDNLRRPVALRQKNMQCSSLHVSVIHETVTAHKMVRFGNCCLFKLIMLTETILFEHETGHLHSLHKRFSTQK